MFFHIFLIFIVFISSSSFSFFKRDSFYLSTSENLLILNMHILFSFFFPSESFTENVILEIWIVKNYFCNYYFTFLKFSPPELLTFRFQVFCSPHSLCFIVSYLTSLSLSSCYKIFPTSEVLRKYIFSLHLVFQNDVIAPVRKDCCC